MTTRRVLVTGGNSGIGLATAVELARREYAVVASVRSDAKAEVVHEAAREAGVEIETVLLDVTDADRCNDLVPGLDLYGLVNNAGYAVAGAVEDVTDEEARQLLDTMVLAPMRLARLALPAMRVQGDGRIINVSSIAGLASAPFAGWYTASKHALEAVSDSLRVEVARDGVRVILVEPGGFKTGIWDDFRAAVARYTESGSRNLAAYERAMSLEGLVEPIMGSPGQVAKVIAGAFKSRIPRTRYLVGLDAMAIQLTTRLTPTQVQDRVVRLVLGI